MWVELVIWLIIALGIVCVVRHYRIKHSKAGTSYQIFMPDVDGLIVGSPVKFMGVEIGYISKIKIIGSDVYVKFLITEKDMKLPKGVIATTEFTGLGGSKSLELYPPTQDSLASNKIIDVQAPTRLRDVIVLFYQMIDKINAISQKAGSFQEKTGTIKFDEMQDNINTINDGVEVLSGKLGTINNKSEGSNERNEN